MNSYFFRFESSLIHFRKGFFVIFFQFLRINSHVPVIQMKIPNYCVGLDDVCLFCSMIKDKIETIGGSSVFPLGLDDQ